MDAISSHPPPPPPPPTSASHPQRRPENSRSSTDPSPSELLHGWFKEKERQQQQQQHHRNRSPYSRTHFRSRSSGAALLSAPAMTRSHSSPNPYTSRSFEHSTPATISPSSSSGRQSPVPSQQLSPARARSPFKPAQEEGGSTLLPLRPTSWFESSTTGSSIEAIQEDSELDFSPRRPQSAHLPQPQPLAPHSSHSRSNSLRRRPASPLTNMSSIAQSPAPTSFPASTSDQPNSSPASNSPALGPQKFNETYPPPLHHYASSSSFSSVPSTPTSARSRSPSISSLETIEDAPEEESEALEEERILRLKLAAERAEQGESDSEGEGSGVRRRNGSLDVPRFGRGSLGRDRKRWSVCGGERRADLDLETIWED